MNCAKCGLDLPAGARQCPKCGTVNEFAASEQQPRRPVKPVVYAIAALGAIALLALVVAVIAGRGRNDVTSAPPVTPPPSGGVTSAPSGQAGGGGLTSAPAPVPGPESAGIPGATKPKPSKAVVEYLEFVKKVEEHRQMLLKDTGEALTMMVAGQAQSIESMLDWLDEGKGGQVSDPLAKVKHELARQHANWRSTLQYFDKQAAPPECRAFSGAYRAVLYREAERIGRVDATLRGIDIMSTQGMTDGFRALQSMKGDPRLQSDIDKAADSADASLTQLVSNYDMEKPFDVPREEPASGSIMGF